MSFASLEGKIALVTGAARGIGQGIALALAEAGADLIVTDLDAPEETTASVEAAGRRVVSALADVRDQKTLDVAVERGVRELGGLDIVVANAGINGWNHFWEISEEEWESVVDVNLNGTWRTLKAAVPYLIDQGRGGSMIATNSVAGMKALPTQAHYTASKHGVVGLVRTAAIELGPHGIRVNSVHPWGVDTRLTADSPLDSLLKEHRNYRASFSAAMKVPPIAQPADVAQAVLWLASDESRFVTGIQLPVDMGATIV